MYQTFIARPSSRDRLMRGLVRARNCAGLQVNCPPPSPKLQWPSLPFLTQFSTYKLAIQIVSVASRLPDSSLLHQQQLHKHIKLLHSPLSQNRWETTNGSFRHLSCSCSSFTRSQLHPSLFLLSSYQRLTPIDLVVSTQPPHIQLFQSHRYVNYPFIQRVAIRNCARKTRVWVAVFPSTSHHARHSSTITSLHNCRITSIQGAIC